jgi:glyoxylase-like metal-dependent hydrolase (beta-lactamase superfamily II)
MTRLSRRQAIFAGAALPLAAALPLPAIAKAELQGAGFAPFHRFKLGAFEVTTLLAGTRAGDKPQETFGTNASPEDFAALSAANFIPADKTQNFFTPTVVNTGAELVLFDTGLAAEGTLAAMTAAGFTPDQVDVVVLTHMHGDHIGGLMQAGKIAFPNATVHADKHDADFWLSAESLEKAPKEMKMYFQGAQMSLNPYVSAGKFKAFEGSAEIVPGIQAVAAHGHTPGHAIYVVESKGQKLVLWGDLIHVAAVQFPKPAVTISFDSDSKAAAVQRRKAFADAARGRYWVAGAHLPFPGIGHLRADGKGYVFVPVNYSPVR